MNALEMARYIACTLYTEEFCAVCGFAIKVDAPKTSVWKDVDGKKMPGTAHKDCLLNRMPESPSINNH